MLGREDRISAPITLSSTEKYDSNPMAYHHSCTPVRGTHTDKVHTKSQNNVTLQTVASWGSAKLPLRDSIVMNTHLANLRVWVWAPLVYANLSRQELIGVRQML